MAAKKQTYEQAMKRLEEIVSRIDSNELDIDSLGVNLKEAQELIKFCRDKLYKADEEIKKMLENLFCYDSFKEDYKILNTEVRKLGYNIPPLVNAYMSLSPTMRMFGTAINYGFGDVEETGILIAVNEILEDKRVRHIESFVKQHPEAMKITSGAHPILTK